MKDAAEYMKQRALDPTTKKKGATDAVRLALSATAMARRNANARASLQSPSPLGYNGHGSVIKTSERPEKGQKLSDIIIESPVNGENGESSIMSQISHELLHEDNEHDLAEAQHNNEAEFLVSHALKNPGSISGIQPIDTFINFLLPPSVITPSNTDNNNHNNNNTKTNATLEFDTNDEDGDGIPYTTPK